MTFAVTIELTNCTKFYNMNLMELIKFLENLEDKSKRFIEVPSANIHINVDKIVYVWYRELQEKKGLSSQGTS